MNAIFVLGLVATLAISVSGQLSYKHMGCYVDTGSRDLRNRYYTYTDMTVEACAAHCQGYQFFAVQSGNQCFCDNAYGIYCEDVNGCRTSCAGNKNQTCGDSYRNNVYMYQPDRRQTYSKYIGCFKDTSQRDLPHSYWNDNRMTHDKCAAHCRAYKYMGVQGGTQCYCGDTYNTHGESTACKTDCKGDSRQTCGGSWANSVYELPKKESLEITEIGCFADGGARDLPHRTWTHTSMTPQKCAAHCQGFQYFGLQYSSYCFCGNSYGKYGEYPDTCTMDCGGDKSQKCGSTWRNRVFRIGADRRSPMPKYIGCFSDSSKRDLPHRTWTHTLMTPRRCAQHCTGYRYMGLQYGSYCFCGDTYGSYKEDPTRCTTACAGDKTQMCGYTWRNSIYELVPDAEVIAFATRAADNMRRIGLKRATKLFIPDYSVSLQGDKGTLTKWNITTFDTQENYLTVWRPVGARGTKFSFVGGTYFTPLSPGQHQVDASIEMEKGDVLGIYRGEGAAFVYNKFNSCGGVRKLRYASGVSDSWAVGDEIEVADYKTYCGNPYFSAEVNV